MLQYKKVLFVHIPKTAGSSIYDYLRKNNLENWIRTSDASTGSNHDPLFLLESNNDIAEAYKFCVVRNPYRRAFSHYMHTINRKNFNICFNEFLNYVRLNGVVSLLGFSDSDQKIFTTRFPYISFSQTFYTQNHDGDIAMDKIYKTEKLQEFENDFSTKLPFINKGMYDNSDYLSSYTKTNINLVKNLYSIDFQNFNYSNNFDDSVL